MNRETFLNELMAGLTQLGPVEQRQVADYYNELIFDGVENGKPEEEIIAGFGAPEEIAAQIRVEYKSQQAVEGAPGQGAVPPRPACLEYPAQEPVHTVVVDARNVRVNVRAVPGGGVRVLFQPRENDRVTVAEKDGAFLFTHTMSIFNVWNWLDLLRGPHDITLELPLDFAGEVCVKTCNAGITVSSLSAGGKGRFVTSNARITVENCVFGSLAAKTSNGPITLSGVTGGDCEAASNNARITAEHCRFAEKLWMQTSNGPVRAEDVEAPDLTFKTANAAITGTVVGDMRDYAISSRTSNAQNNLPMDCAYEDQAKRLWATTSNGRIDVRFV